MSSGPGQSGIGLELWVDTAFDGYIVCSADLIRRMGLRRIAKTQAILADGTEVSMKTFKGFVDWFGEVQPVQVIQNEVAKPLLGTALLSNRRLTID